MNPPKSRGFWSCPTCKLHGVNPEAYFTDVLTKLVNNWPNSRLAQLLPWAWTPNAA